MPIFRHGSTEAEESTRQTFLVYAPVLVDVNRFVVVMPYGADIKHRNGLARKALHINRANTRILIVSKKLQRPAAPRTRYQHKADG